jgi:hypothetical protein
MSTTKKLDLNLNAFLYSIICFTNKEINKHLYNQLGNTNDIMFSLTNFLDFDPITIFFMSHIYPCINEIILNITFKFTAEFNMKLIFNCFYAPRKK